MNTFIWKGKDPQGNDMVERVYAENAQQAKQVLVRQGWTDLEMVMEEVCDTASGFVDGPPEYKEQVSAEQQVKFFERKGPGFWGQYGKTVADSWISCLISAGMLAWGLYAGKFWMAIIGGVGLALLLLLFPFLHLFFSTPMQYYSRLNKAKVWSRYDEVLACVERLRQIRRYTKIGPGEAELVRCRAQALAFKGQLQAGLDEFSRFANDPVVPEWMYLSLKAGIFDCAKQFKQSLECRRRATELKPDTGAVWIDLAYVLVRGLNEPAQAREAVARAETLESNKLGKAYLSFLRGIIAWREGDNATAKSHLEEALPGFQAFAHSPLAESIILLDKAYLCAVLGPLGDLAGARKYFAEVEEFLQAGRETELLEACRKSVGLAQATQTAAH